ncbi:anti sigma-E factor RseA C-terminal domain-containing protein [Halomonas shantousis]
MNQSLRESLSVLMDNEGDELELRRVLKSLGESPEEADVWRRYHLARSMMQRDREADVSVDLSAGIMSRIASEPLPEVETRSAPRRGSPFSFAGSAAIAAAVTLMVIGGARFYNVGGEDAGTQGELAGLDGENRSRTTLPVANETAPLTQFPLFQSPAASDGLMAVGAEAPFFMSPSQRQSQQAEVEQTRALQAYLDRHAQGAAYRSGDAWMPLLRSNGYVAQESPSQR